jgi:hypothetical protein
MAGKRILFPHCKKGGLLFEDVRFFSVAFAFLALMTLACLE